MNEFEDLVLPLLRFIDDQGGVRRTRGVDAWQPVREWAEANELDPTHVRRRLRAMAADGLLTITETPMPGMTGNVDFSFIDQIDLLPRGLRAIEIWPDTRLEWIPALVEAVTAAIESGELSSDEEHKAIAARDFLTGVSVATVVKMLFSM